MAAVCAFSAAVVPTDVAVVCNRAFFGGRAGFATPSFQAETPPPRPGRAEGPETAAAAEGGDAEGPVAALPRAACRDEGPLPALPRAAGARRAPIGAARATASPRIAGCFAVARQQMPTTTQRGARARARMRTLAHACCMHVACAYACVRRGVHQEFPQEVDLGIAQGRPKASSQGVMSLQSLAEFGLTSADIGRLTSTWAKVGPNSADHALHKL